MAKSSNNNALTITEPDYAETPLKIRGSDNETPDNTTEVGDGMTGSFIRQSFENLPEEPSNIFLNDLAATRDSNRPTTMQQARISKKPPIKISASAFRAAEVAT